MEDFIYILEYLKIPYRNELNFGIPIIRLGTWGYCNVWCEDWPTRYKATFNYKLLEMIHSYYE